ncbi:MAG TPA: chromosome segregation protein SMC, partial [Pseudothermotoga sp.]
MLIRFHGENLLYFNNFDIEFDDRLNVITGETGAGKSILLKALQALLGNKTELPAGNG